MAVELTKKDDDGSESEDDRRRKLAERTREQFGIENLTEGEELVDSATFAQIQDHLALARGEHVGGMDHSVAEVDELLLEEIATELPVHSPHAAHGSLVPADAAEVAVLERSLLDARDRGEVAELTLRIALHYARVAALFVWHRGLIAGLRGAGEGLENRLEGIMVPADTGSMLAAPLESRRMARGEPTPHAVDQRLLRAMGREGTSEVAVLPIAIGRRVVNLLYVDNGSEALSDTGLGALRVLCAGVGRVYERLILEAKLARRTPARGA